MTAGRGDGTEHRRRPARLRRRQLRAPPRAASSAWRNHQSTICRYRIAQDVDALSWHRQFRGQRGASSIPTRTDQRDVLQSRDQRSSGRCGSSRRTATRRTTNSRSAVSVEQMFLPTRARQLRREARRKPDFRAPAEETTNYELASKTTSTVSDGLQDRELVDRGPGQSQAAAGSLGDGRHADEVVDKQLTESSGCIDLCRRCRAERGDRLRCRGGFHCDRASEEPMPPVGIMELSCIMPALSSTPSPSSS